MPLKLSSLSRSFKHKNYKLFFIGQLVSLIGTWVTTVATSWLVYRLTQSAVLLGYISFASTVPSLLFSPFAGVMVDRWNRHTTLLITQTASMIQSFTLATLTITGTVSVTHLLVLSVFQGIVNAFDMPARQAFVSEIVESAEDLSNAIALNSGMFNASRLVGPFIGGLIIAASNEGICFLIDGFSYLAVIFALRKMTLKPFIKNTTPHNIFHELQDGFKYILNFKSLGILIGLVALISFAVTPYVVLMPIFAAEILAGGPDTLGILMGGSGCGALFGALYLASRTTVVGLGRVILFAGICLASALIALSFTATLWSAVMALFVIGLSTILLIASCNTLVQTLVEPTRRGRTMSLFGMAFMGTMPLSSLFAGWCAHIIGTQYTIALGGVVAGISIWFFWRMLPKLRQELRPIYIERGYLS